MSFQEGNTTGDIRDSLSTIKRRITRNELVRTDKDTMLDSVHNMRTQIDMLKIDDIIDNLSSNAIGPYDLVFEPDTVEVKIYNNFANVYGDGRIINQTLGSVDYDSISIGDNPVIMPQVEAGTYHYEPYAGFNGTSDFVSVSDTAALDLFEFAISCWFKTNRDFLHSAFLVNKGGTGSDTAGQNDNYSISLTSGETMKAGFEEADGTDHYVVAPTSFHDDIWHNAVVTYDGIKVELFMDGVEVDSHSTTATPETNAQPLVIGRNSRISDNFFRGLIDEVYVWNHHINDVEISDLYNYGTIPDVGNIVYSNTFGGSGITIPTKKCYYSVPDGANNWTWRMGHHPPSVKSGSSIGLNIGSNTGQFIYYDGFGTDFDFTANNASFGFWIYPTSISSASNTVLMHRRIDSNNSIKIEIDDADFKLFGVYSVGGVDSKREYATPITTNGWYYINCTLSFAGPTLSLKVNNNADTSSTKSATGGSSNDKLYFGGHAALAANREFHGYLAFPIWYKHSTVLTTAQRTALYNYNTKSDTTKPFVLGFAELG